VVGGVGYPGWIAEVDGESSPLEVADVVLRGVRVGPGPHVIELRFVPWSVYGGMSITLLALIGLGALWKHK